MGTQQRAERFTIHTPREPRGIGVDPADDPRLIAFREMLRKKNPVLMARDRFDDRHRTMARLREAQIEEEHRARERLLWTMRNRASQEWRQQHRARGDIAQTIAGMRADSPDSLADVSRYFDNLPDADAQVVHGPSAAAPRKPRSPQDSEADEDYMQFTQKSDTEAAPERGRSGKPSVYRPKVDITIDSRNIETPPRSRERSPKIPNYDEYARAAASAAPAASSYRTSGRLSSFQRHPDSANVSAPTRRSGRSGR